MAQEQPSERGIRYWMQQVVSEAERARDGLKADPVHDLRVAIRRCRAIGQAFAVLDPHPSWKKMRNMSKPVFSALGELRDIQVQMEWIEKLAGLEDPVRIKLMALCEQREKEYKLAAAAQLAKFDPSQWLQWAGTLEERSQTIPPGGEVFQLMALERWEEAHRLHAHALRNRSKVAMHQLRIAVKKFRYIVENFLPDLHEKWKKDLKHMQDVLGEVHDVDVLWDMARLNHAFASPDQRRWWLDAIKKERSERINAYREAMVGRNSLWNVWRSELPNGQALHAATMKFFETWSFYRDPDLSHTHRVLKASRAIFDTLSSTKLLRIGEFEGVPLRDLLTVAVLTHESGQDHRRKNNKEVQHLLDKLTPPPGWSARHLTVIGLAVRFHVGKLPSTQKAFLPLSRFMKRIVDMLAAVMRLAEAFDFDHSGKIQRITPVMSDGQLTIEAIGYEERSRLALRVASARHPLEVISSAPIIVKSFQEQSQQEDSKSWKSTSSATPARAKRKQPQSSMRSVRSTAKASSRRS